MSIVIEHYFALGWHFCVFQLFQFRKSLSNNEIQFGPRWNWKMKLFIYASNDSEWPHRSQHLSAIDWNMAFFQKRTHKICFCKRIHSLRSVTFFEYFQTKRQHKATITNNRSLCSCLWFVLYDQPFSLLGKMIQTDITALSNWAENAGWHNKGLNIVKECLGKKKIASSQIKATGCMTFPYTQNARPHEWMPHSNTQRKCCVAQMAFFMSKQQTDIIWQMREVAHLLYPTTFVPVQFYALRFDDITCSFEMTVFFFFVFLNRLYFQTMR